MSIRCPACPAVLPDGTETCTECGFVLVKRNPVTVFAGGIQPVGDEPLGQDTWPAGGNKTPGPTPLGPDTRNAFPEEDPEADDLPSGSLLWNRFRIKAMLGRGGMGVVYKAVDEALRVTVAVKVLSAELIADPVAVERLKQEVLTARGLRHANIVQVTQYYPDERQAGFDMEYLEGATLAEHLAGRVEGSPFAPPATVDRLPVLAEVVDQLASALDHIHEKGLVHRDVKPSNVMLVPRSGGGFGVKLLDFGIVQAGDGSGLTGQLPPGTLEYMARELLSGRGKPSPRSDIYSVGKVVYYALTGEPAEYGHDSDHPSDLVESLPSSVDAPVLACMGRLDRRPESAGRLASVIREAAEEYVARVEAERKAKAEAERKAKVKAKEAEERRAREETERKAKAEAERNAKADAERKAREEAVRKANEEAERRATVAADRKAKEEAERWAEEEAERQARVEAERTAKAEAERKTREETERKAREESERKAKAEAERKAKAEAEAEWRAKEEADRKAKAEAARKAREEAERIAKAELARKAEEERKAREEAKEDAERKAKEQAKRRAQDEAERKAREEAERKAKAEAEREAREEAKRRAKEEAERELSNEQTRLSIGRAGLPIIGMATLVLLACGGAAAVTWYSNTGHKWTPADQERTYGTEPSEAPTGAEGLQIESGDAGETSETALAGGAEGPSLDEESIIADGVIDRLAGEDITALPDGEEIDPPDDEEITPAEDVESEPEEKEDEPLKQEGNDEREREDQEPAEAAPTADDGGIDPSESPVADQTETSSAPWSDIQSLGESGSPETIEMVVSPATLPKDGESSSNIWVKVLDSQGRLVIGEAIVIAASGGVLSNELDHGDGTFTAQLTAPLGGEDTRLTVSASRLQGDLSVFTTVTLTPMSPTMPRSKRGRRK